MVSKKKRVMSPVVAEPMEPVRKKAKKESRKPSPKKVKEDVFVDPDIELLDEEEDLDLHPLANVNDVPDWPEGDLLELMKRMEANIPPKDALRFDSRAARLNWDVIKFGDYTADECRNMWQRIQKRLRRFRLLREVLEDGKAWVSRPWTNFYRSQKQNRHPDMPRRPLSTYMLFYLEKKDKVAKQNPGMEMTNVSKCIAELYKTLPEKKKKKYVEKAAEQRRKYEEEMEAFYQEHPHLVPKPSSMKEPKPASALEVGPKKPLTPFKVYYQDNLIRHQNDPNFDKNALLERCKEQWRNMSDKKKVVWINWALDAENKYREELKAYSTENPEFNPGMVKTVLTKEEKNLAEKIAGKPDKPPNSGYSLFSRRMLVDPSIKTIPPKSRMMEISKRWKRLSDMEKKNYQEQVNHMLEQYKLEYASYLESLPEDKKAEELKNNQPKRKAPTLKAKVSAKPKPKAKSNAKEGKDLKNKKKTEPAMTLFEGEPVPPPVNVFQLFLKTFSAKAGPNVSEEEAANCWQRMSDDEKTKYRNKLHDLKQKYILDYEMFLKSLTPEQLKAYSVMKQNAKKDEEDDEDEDEDDDDEDDDDDDDDEEDEDDDEDDDGDNVDGGSSQVSGSVHKQSGNAAHAQLTNEKSDSDDDSSSDSDSDSEDSTNSGGSKAGKGSASDSSSSDSDSN